MGSPFLIRSYMSSKEYIVAQTRLGTLWPNFLIGSSVPTIKSLYFEICHLASELAGNVRFRQLIPSSWATKVSTIGQQALLGAEGTEESQGHKALGIQRPWVHKAKRFKKLARTKVSKTLGLATDLTNASDRSAARTLPKARLTYFPRLTVIRPEMVLKW